MKRAAPSWSTDAGPAIEAPATPAPVPAPTPTKEPKVRITVDVRRDDHRALKRTADAMADELGVSRVPIQQIMAALAHQITTDQQLRSAVTTYLRDSVAQ